MPVNNYLEIARDVFAIEANAITNLSKKIDDNFIEAVRYILSANSRVIVCGMGKSGIIGKKIAATLASTGTPSFFMHPGEAYHGDLGMVMPDDVFIAISNSGETEEVLKLIPFLRDNGNYLVALTGNALSTLAKAANNNIDIGVEEEACPLKLAPTSSTTATLAMGDALAITLMKGRDFDSECFARFHPGGSLGRRLLGRVSDEMAKGNLPLANPSSKVLDVIKVMTKGSHGLAIIYSDGCLGVVTDGDIRRAVEAYGEEVFNKTAAQLMTKSPITVRSDMRIDDAVLLMERRKVNSLIVIDDGVVVGVLKK